MLRHPGTVYSRCCASLLTLCSLLSLGLVWAQDQPKPAEIPEAVVRGDPQAKAGGEVGQEQTPADDPAAEKAKRLQELQQRVQDLQKEIQSLRAQSEQAPSAPPTETKQPAEKPRTELPKGSEAKAPVAATQQAQAAAPADSVATTFKSEWLKSLTWRCIGPASMGGRIVDIATVDSDPCCYFVATGSGGLFKTTNDGITFTPLFDHESTVSIGDVAVAPSNPRIIWVGTGEHNARNSVSWGDGVYKSNDGGATWTNVGLKNSYQIGRIAIHPRNPDIVYVGALGKLWAENEDRGVYKTIDGGKTWERVLFVDAKAGCIDLVLNPEDPETILAAMYERQRGIYDEGDPAKRWGPGSGLYKSVNGGRNWTKLTQGLPTVHMGRIGVTYSKKNPKTVFAIIETEKIATGPEPAPGAGGQAFMGIQGEDATGGARLTTVTPDGPAHKAGLKAGDLISEVGSQTIAAYADLTARIAELKPGDKLKFKYRRESTTAEAEVVLAERPAGSARAPAATGPYSGGLGGQRENVQDRQGADGFQTGGVYRSLDGGETWLRVNSLNPRPFYYSQIIVDPNDENLVYVLGVSSYRSKDGGKTFTADLARGIHSDHHALWVDPRDGRHLLLGGDGGLYASHDRGERWEHVNVMPIAQFYHVAVDTGKPYRVYGGLQDNGSWGGPSQTRGQRGPSNDDWVTIGGGDGFVCQVDPQDPEIAYYTSQYGNMGRINVRTGERRTIRPPAQPGVQFRFNWKTPFLLSAHNPKIFYAAGNYVFKSLDRGEQLRTISPRVSATDRGTASALAESPLNPDVLYLGTDDGALWVTRNGGHDWTHIAANLKDVPAQSCVATIEASRFQEGRAYVAIDAHRVDSTAPFVFATEDFGQTWSPLRANLPDGSTRTLREDPQNRDLLFVGTEFGAWASLDRGTTWIKLNNNLPTVAVHEFAFPTTASELVVATHGRGIWVLDMVPLRQMSEKVQKATTHLFKPATATVWISGVSRTLSGHKRFVGENPADGAAIHYLLASPAKDVKLQIFDVEGNTVRQLATKNEPGLHRAVWDLRRLAGYAQVGQRQTGRRQQPAGAQSTSPPETPAAPTSGSQSPATRQPPATLPRVAPGQFRVVLTVDGQESSQVITVEPDPLLGESVRVEEVTVDEDEDD